VFSSNSLLIIAAAVSLSAAGCSKLDAQANDELAPASINKVIAGQSSEILVASSAVAPTAGATGALLQVGPWTPMPANFEEPFINLVHASPVSWTRDNDEWTTAKMYSQGVLDPVTGLPRTLPEGWMRSGVYFTSPPGSNKARWAGEWVLEWEGKADLSMLWLPGGAQWRAGSNRVEFTRSADMDHAAISISRLKEPLRAVRIFRKENEAALRAGKIYNPRFIEEVRKYDVVRTMDLQEVNRTMVTQVEELSTMAACCWNNLAWKDLPRKTDHPFRSMPLAAMFALAVEADNALWHTAPLELGAPKRFYDPSIMSDDNGVVAGAWRALARENAADILASKEWDRYADRFVAALAASGYPSERPLYTTISNEVWNFAFQYTISTNYAWGLGEGLEDGGHYRHGYGAALARWKLALDAALTRAGREQAVVYVVEGQAANPSTTADALGAAKRLMEARGKVWEEQAPDFGVSVASYWGSPDNWSAVASAAQWPGAGETEAAALEDRLINGPAAEWGTRAWVLARFDDHAQIGAGFGVRLVGAYEGGPHLEKPREVARDFYTAFLWGARGAAVNTAVNDALAEAYPGIILSNYVLAGPIGGQPWFDGEYGEANEMQQSWEKYQRR
jgi:hypothetical protein